MRYPALLLALLTLGCGPTDPSPAAPAPDDATVAAFEVVAKRILRPLHHVERITSPPERLEPAERRHDLGPDGVQNVGGRTSVVGGHGDTGSVVRQDDAELPVDAVHTPGAVAGAQPDVPAVPRVVRVWRGCSGGDVAIGRHGVGGHALHIVRRNDRPIAPAPVVEQHSGESGEFFGTEVQPDRTEEHDVWVGR